MIEAFGVGAAVLAFWTVARYPSFGPQSVGAAALFTVGMFVLQTPLLALVTPVVRTAGIAAGLLFVILPSLTLLFWATGCLVRSLVALAAPYRR